MSIGKNICFVLGTVLYAAVSLLLIGDCYMRYQTAERIVLPEEAAKAAGIEAFDCVLVLGCGAWGEEPSPMLEDRLLTGLGLRELGISAPFLVSGDHGSVTYDEVNLMKRWYTEKGIASDEIFMDHAGFSTYESIYRASAVFGAKRVLIVSQGYHLYRALYVAQSLGMEAYGVAADLRTYRKQPYYDIREVAARNKELITCLFWPEPTYLGERISLSGSGDVTNDTP